MSAVGSEPCSVVATAAAGAALAVEAAERRGEGDDLRHDLAHRAALEEQRARSQGKRSDSATVISTTRSESQPSASSWSTVLTVSIGTRNALANAS
jgi:hypothetical protein